MYTNGRVIIKIEITIFVICNCVILNGFLIILLMLLLLLVELVVLFIFIEFFNVVLFIFILFPKTLLLNSVTQQNTTPLLTQHKNK